MQKVFDFISTPGTAKLNNRQTLIPFPHQFVLISNPNSIIVPPTPLYSNTYGLTVLEMTRTGFYIEELMNDNGQFAFDFLVKCVRKGYEDFKTVRSK